MVNYITKSTYTPKCSTAKKSIEDRYLTGVKSIQMIVPNICTVTVQGLFDAFFKHGCGWESAVLYLTGRGDATRLKHLTQRRTLLK